MNASRRALVTASCAALMLTVGCSANDQPTPSSGNTTSSSTADFSTESSSSSTTSSTKSKPQPTVGSKNTPETTVTTTPSSSGSGSYFEPFGFTEAPGEATPSKMNKTISHCGGKTEQRGTTFFTDGTSGWTVQCAEFYDKQS